MYDTIYTHRNTHTRTYTRVIEKQGHIHINTITHPSPHTNTERERQRERERDVHFTIAVEAKPHESHSRRGAPFSIQRPEANLVSTKPTSV